MKVLFIFPHPDDESIFSGGTIARHVAAGDEVVWICAGYGEKGGQSLRRPARFFYSLFKSFGKYSFFVPLQNAVIRLLSYARKPNARLAEIRKGEAMRTAEIFGINRPVFFGIEDMNFAGKKNMIIKKIREQILAIKPDIIYTLHPDGITGHPDHVALTASVKQASEILLSQEGKISLFGAVIPSEVIVKYRLPFIGERPGENIQSLLLTEEELAKKIQAINAYRSQDYLWKIFLDRNRELLRHEYFLKLN